MLLVIPVIAVLCSVGFWLVLGRPRFAPERTGDAGRISVVVPARDEERNIGGLLESLGGQREVIVVDDGSSDRTAEVAAELGAKVVPAGDLPEGWKGKPWACQQGAAAAEGEWLLFLDADTRMEDGALDRLGGLAEEGGTVYSLCPYHRIESVAEEWSAFFNVLMVAGVGAFGRREAEGEALFGQCLLIAREDYERVGGHERVKGQVLENFHLAAALEEEGIGRRCFLGRGVVRMRMFTEGVGELWRSWQKGFAAGAGHVEAGALLWSSVWISGAMFAVLPPPHPVRQQLGKLLQQLLHPHPAPRRDLDGLRMPLPQRRHQIGLVHHIHLVQHGDHRLVLSPQLRQHLEGRGVEGLRLGIAGIEDVNQEVRQQ